MLHSWLSSKSSRHRRVPSNPSPALDINAQPSPSDASSVSQSTAGPLQTPGNLTSASDVPLDEVHAHINDPNVYAHTPSLIHNTERETGTSRTSDAPPSLDATPSRRESTRIPQRVSALEQRPEDTPFTPQDAMIAQIFGGSVSPFRAVSPPPPSTTAPQTSDSVPMSSSIPASRVRLGPALTIYDPFSGAKLGEHTPISPSTATPSTPTSVDDRKLWSSLERILELQAEIAAMHADMEGVGTKGLGNNALAGGIAGVGSGDGGNVGAKKRMRRGQTLPIGDEELEEPEPEGGGAGATVSEISTDHSGGEDDEEDEEDEDGIHGYGKKRRGEEFAKLAEQFAQRKAAIGGIMNKLDALSIALKTFHTLPPPLFDLAVAPPRTDTMSSGPTPPLPAQVSSSISPPGARTPPKTSIFPPVPPASTLASATSSGVSSVAPIVAPVLPTIIPGAMHVESPAEIEHAHSVIFQGAP